MKKLRKLFVVAAVAVGIVAFNACDTSEISEENVPVTKISDYINMSNSFSLTMEEEITNDNDGGFKSVNPTDCLTVSIHENENGEFWPRNWTLDYGTENCETFNGNFKRGKINISLTDWWRNEGSLKEITFEEYFFNDNKMEGTKTILNTGLNEAGNLTFTKNIIDASVTYPDASSMSWSCEKFSELIEGGDSFLFADDVWSVTGSGAGVNIDGKNYTMTITSPLIYINGCFYPVSGIIEIAVDGEELIVINYGDGGCDSIATSTCCGVTEIIDL